MNKSTDYKIIVIGDASVGKTSIIMQYHNNVFDPNHHETIGASFIQKQIEVDGEIININIWDTAGQEKYRSLVPMYTRNTSCAIIVFDVTNTQSYDILISWYQQVKEEAPENCRIVIAGNKIDQIPDFENNKNNDDINKIENFAEENKSDIFYVSAKTGKNIKEMFENITKNFPLMKMQSQTESMRINSSEEKKCC